MPNLVKILIPGAEGVFLPPPKRSLFAWGWNANGELGTGGDTSDVPFPVQVGTNSDWDVVSANGHTLAIRDGELWAWGSNSDGQLGDGTTTSRTEPVRIGTESDWDMVSACVSHSLGIRNGGELWAWGRNNLGQLGDGTTTNRHEPVRIGTESDWSLVAGGSIHSLGIRNGGELWAWGGNWDGQLGDGTGDDSLVPIRVGTESDWEQISSGDYHCLGLRNGQIWAWGANWSGQIGDGGYDDAFAPVRIGADSDWSMVAAGGYHSFSIRNGELWAWGDNWAGQLGVGSTSAYDEPVRIGTESDWSLVAGGSIHSLGIRNGGELWAWGGNNRGQVGDGTGGTGTNRNAPVRIGEHTTWLRVAAGDAHSLGIIDTSNFPPIRLRTLLPGAEGALAATSENIVVARLFLESSEGDLSAIATRSVNEARASLAGAEGSFAAIALIRYSVWASLPGAEGVLIPCIAAARASLPGVESGFAVLARTYARVYAHLPSAEGHLAAFGVSDFDSAVSALLDGAEGGLRAYAFLDWSGLINPLTTQTYYAMDLVKSGETVRIPISSWQGTLQLDRASYLQCVIPAALDWIDTVLEYKQAGGQFSIKRGARFSDGKTQETEIASAPMQDIRADEGPTNATVTISGYMHMAPPEIITRPLQNIRSRSFGNALRIRCDIDWFLRPGMLAGDGASAFTVGFMNLYVNRNDQYMDVGEQRDG